MRACEFLNSIPLLFCIRYPNEDQKDVIDMNCKILKVLRATVMEGVELGSFRLRDVAILFYEGWEKYRDTNVPLAGGRSSPMTL